MKIKQIHITFIILGFLGLFLLLDMIFDFDWDVIGLFNSVMFINVMMMFMSTSKTTRVFFEREVYRILAVFSGLLGALILYDSIYNNTILPLIGFLIAIFIVLFVVVSFVTMKYDEYMFKNKNSILNKYVAVLTENDELKKLKQKRRTKK